MLTFYVNNFISIPCSKQVLLRFGSILTRQLKDSTYLYLSIFYTIPTLVIFFSFKYIVSHKYLNQYYSSLTIWFFKSKFILLLFLLPRFSISTDEINYYILSIFHNIVYNLPFLPLNNLRHIVKIAFLRSPLHSVCSLLIQKLCTDTNKAILIILIQITLQFLIPLLKQIFIPVSFKNKSFIYCSSFLQYLHPIQIKRIPNIHKNSSFQY